MGIPLHGVVRGPAKGRDHIVLFWLRLPLSEDGGRVDRILCYDVAGPTAEARAATERSLPLLSAPSTATAVAVAAGASRLSSRALQASG